MRSTNGCLLIQVLLMLACLCAGANLRLKRSDSKPDLDLDSNGFCVTAKNWKVDCNDCFCPVGGAPACTLRGCIRIPEPEVVELVELKKEEEVAVKVKVKRSEDESNADEKCKPGSTWAEDCNACYCSEDAKPYCTKAGCFGDVTQSDHQSQYRPGNCIEYSPLVVNNVLNNLSTHQCNNIRRYIKHIRHVSEVLCYQCKTTLPICIATGQHILKENFAACPECDFPCFKSEMSKILDSTNQCPMCDEIVDSNRLNDVENVASYLSGHS